MPGRGSDAASRAALGPPADGEAFLGTGGGVTGDVLTGLCCGAGLSLGTTGLLSAGGASETETADTIADVQARSAYVLDPHTAADVNHALKRRVKSQIRVRADTRALRIFRLQANRRIRQLKSVLRMPPRLRELVGFYFKVVAVFRVAHFKALEDAVVGGCGSCGKCNAVRPAGDDVSAAGGFETTWRWKHGWVQKVCLRRHYAENR